MWLASTATDTPPPFPSPVTNFGAETFLANTDAQIFFGNSDMTTLNYISNRLGQLTDDDLGKEPPQLKHFRRANKRFLESAQETISGIDVENVMRRDWH